MCAELLALIAPMEWHVVVECRVEPPSNLKDVPPRHHRARVRSGAALADRCRASNCCRATVGAPRNERVQPRADKVYPQRLCVGESTPGAYCGLAPRQGWTLADLRCGRPWDGRLRDGQLAPSGYTDMLVWLIGARYVTAIPWTRVLGWFTPAPIGGVGTCGNPHAPRQASATEVIRLRPTHSRRPEISSRSLGHPKVYSP